MNLTELHIHGFVGAAAGATDGGALRAGAYGSYRRCDGPAVFGVG